jgi:deazaflavin-dependent oxidoreductase (nitroreductase family)
VARKVCRCSCCIMWAPDQEFDRVAPLAYWPLTDRAVAVLASNFGAPTHPAWFHNLLANPKTTVEIGPDTWTVRARVGAPGARKSASRKACTYAGSSSIRALSRVQLRTSGRNQTRSDHPRGRIEMAAEDGQADLTVRNAKVTILPIDDDVAETFAVRGEQFVADGEAHAIGVMFRMIVSSDRFRTRTSSGVRPPSRRSSNS